MKKSFKKLFLSCAAVAALSAVIATSAMAAGEITGTYDAATGNVALTSTTAVPAGETTILVLNNDAETVVATDIKYINQEPNTEGGNVFSSIPVGTELADGTYYVRMGGETGQILTGTFTVGAQGHEVLVGDADQNAKVTSGDATTILKHTTDDLVLTGDALLAAQMCDGVTNTKVTSGDATQVLKYTTDEAADPVGTKVTVNN